MMRPPAQVVPRRSAGGEPNEDVDTLLGGVFAFDGGTWHVAAKLGAMWSCKAFIDALRSGRFTVAPPLARALNDVVVGGTRLHVLPFDPPLPCPK